MITTDDIVKRVEDFVGLASEEIERRDAEILRLGAEIERLRCSPDSEPFDPFGVALILKDQTAELERLRQNCAWQACIIKACDAEMNRLRGLLRAAGIDPTLSSESGE